MLSTISPSVRMLRALVLALVTLSVGAAAHISSDGLMPGPAPLVVLVALFTALGACFLGRPAGPVRVMLLLVAGQTLMHGVFSLTAGHGQASAMSPAPLDPATLSPIPQQFGSQLQSRGLSAPVEFALPVHLIDPTSPDFRMALAHLVGAALVGLWLAAGERALWRLASPLVSRLAALLIPGSTPAFSWRPLSLPAAADGVLHPAAPHVLDGVRTLRGPPRAHASAL